MVMIPVISLKGGVGKSTVALNIADILSNKNSVLLVDTDPQNSIASLLCKKSSKGIGELLKGEATLEEVVIKVDSKKDFYIIPAGDYAITHPIEYEVLFTERNLERFLKSVDDVDYLIVDTSPRISQPIQVLLAYARFYLIVITPDPASVASLDKFIEYLKTNNLYKKFSIIVNKMAANDISEDFYFLIQALSKNNIIATLPKDIKVVEAEGNCMPVTKYAPNSAFSSFLKELIEKLHIKINEK